jgi:hypothetical protein
LLYVADAFGYLGYVAVMLGKNALRSRQDFLGFFLTASMVIMLISLVALARCWQYFRQRSFSAHVATTPLPLPEQS